MKKKLFILYFTILPLILSSSLGCSVSTQDKAIISANEIRQIVLSEGTIINEYCSSKYQSAKTEQDVMNTDDICVPAQISYYAIRTSWKALVLAIKDAQENKTSSRQIEDAVWQLLNSLVEFKSSVSKMK